MTPPQRQLDAASFPEVLAAARAGDPRAAEVLFVDLQPRLLRFLRGTEPRVADDLAGEVWLGVAQGLGTFDGDLAGFRSWVFVIARRRLADHRRTAGRRATDPVDPHEFFRAHPEPTQVDTDTTVLQQMSAQDAIDFITASLPFDQAEVLLLRVIAELDVAHVAQVLEQSPNWVRVTQHRALRRLAEKFSGDVADPVIPDRPRTI